MQKHEIFKDQIFFGQHLSLVHLDGNTGYLRIEKINR